MKPAIAGIFWCLAFVGLEAVQFVFFGGVFQRISSFLFGFLVFGVSTIAIILWTALRAPEHIARAFRNPGPLIGANVSATFAWGAYMTSVQLIEPAVVYTISAGVMPLTALVAHRFGVKEGDKLRNPVEAAGNLILLVAILFVAATTILGWSGFVRGGLGVALAGVVLAVADGVLFTWMLIYCQRLDRVGVGPTAVFGLRFPLYIMVAGAMVATGVDHKMSLPASEIAVIVVVGLALTIPPLLALHKAVALVSTLTIGALTALGPFMIFGLQIVEGRVDFAPVTLAGLCLYFLGALLAAVGAVAASSGSKSAAGD
jgi:drug/metabolite transporter (DMT)-like permease